jgi:hypothetical protein
VHAHDGDSCTMIADISLIIWSVGLQDALDAMVELFFVGPLMYVPKISDANIDFHCGVLENYFKRPTYQRCRVSQNEGVVTTQLANKRPPRIVTVPDLLYVGIVRVHFAYLNWQILKISNSILTSHVATVEKSMHT